MIGVAKYLRVIW